MKPSPSAAAAAAAAAAASATATSSRVTRPQRRDPCKSGGDGDRAVVFINMGSGDGDGVLYSLLQQLSVFVLAEHVGAVPVLPASFTMDRYANQGTAADKAQKRGAELDTVLAAADLSTQKLGRSMQSIFESSSFSDLGFVDAQAVRGFPSSAAPGCPVCERTAASEILPPVTKRSAHTLVRSLERYVKEVRSRDDTLSAATAAAAATATARLRLRGQRQRGTAAGAGSSPPCRRVLVNFAEETGAAGGNHASTKPFDLTVYSTLAGRSWDHATAARTRFLRTLRLAPRLRLVLGAARAALARRHKHHHGHDYSSGDNGDSDDAHQQNDADAVLHRAAFLYVRGPTVEWRVLCKARLYPDDEGCGIFKPAAFARRIAALHRGQLSSDTILIVGGPGSRFHKFVAALRKRFPRLVTVRDLLADTSALTRQPDDKVSKAVASVQAGDYTALDLFFCALSRWSFGNALSSNTYLCMKLRQLLLRDGTLPGILADSRRPPKALLQDSRKMFFYNKGIANVDKCNHAAAEGDGECELVAGLYERACIVNPANGKAGGSATGIWLVDFPGKLCQRYMHAADPKLIEQAQGHLVRQELARSTAALSG